MKVVIILNWNFKFLFVLSRLTFLLFSIFYKAFATRKVNLSSILSYIGGFVNDGKS